MDGLWNNEKNQKAQIRISDECESKTKVSDVKKMTKVPKQSVKKVQTRISDESEPSYSAEEKIFKVINCII